ncbi:MAG: RNA polymerase sigma factor [Nitriliruptoraceae bacterium]
MEELYRAHATTVFRFLVGMTRDADLAEDLMQDTFVRATRAMGSYRGGSPRAWLLAIARTTALDRFRTRTEQLTDEVPEPSTTDIDVVEQQTVRAALSRLPDDHRTILVLADDLGMPHQEIAEVLGRSPGACRVLLHRARRSFQTAYLEEGGHVH